MDHPDYTPLPKLNVKEMLTVADTFEMSAVVGRYCKNTGEPPERALRIANETKKFLILCALDHDQGYAIQDPIDEMWHTFILFTKPYFKFCRALGKPYIHHAPTEENHRKATGQVRLDSYAKLLKDYETTFGFAPPTDIWPQPGAGQPRKGPDCGPDCSYYPPCCNKE